MLKLGQVIELRTPALPNPFSARVEMVSDYIDPSTRMIKVRAAVDNSERTLKAEMFVTAHIENEASQDVVVPAQAVFLAGDRHYVFVADGPGRFSRTEVVRKAEVNGKVNVQAALKPGQRVVVGNTLLLQQLLDTAAGG